MSSARSAAVRARSQALSEGATLVEADTAGRTAYDAAALRLARAREQQEHHELAERAERH